MKIFILPIIIFISIFSTTNNVFAEGLLDDILNISYGTETTRLDNITINNYNFVNYNTRHKYKRTIEINKLIKDRILLLYKNKQYSRTKVGAIIDNYETFIYYTNQLFNSMYLKERYWYLKNDIDINDNIENSYKNMKIYYRYVNLYLKK